MIKTIPRESNTICLIYQPIFSEQGSIGVIERHTIGTFPPQDTEVKIGKDGEVINLYEKEIGEVMKDYARVEQIRKFKLMEKEWSQDTDELTPTMKLKRMVVNKKYAAQIEEMYVE